METDRQNVYIVGGARKKGDGHLPAHSGKSDLIVVVAWLAA